MKKKIKLLILNYEYPPLGGGAATATQNLLEEYAKHSEIEVDLITSSIDKYKEENFSGNIKIYYLNVLKRGSLHYQSLISLILYSIQTLFLMFKLNKERDYDLVHAFFGVPCGFLAMLLGKRYIISLRGSDVPFYSKKYFVLDFLIFQFLSRLIWNRASYVIANSQGLKDLALRTIPKQDIGIIYNGVDWVEKIPEKQNEKFIVVSTSRLIERKGIDYLIKAFYEFSIGKSDVELRLYGGGHEREKLESMVKDFGITKKVKFYGEVNRNVLYKEICQGNVFVLPSKNEGMSNSLLEAMVRGLAVIATDVGGTKELVDRTNGFIVKKKDSKEISISLERLYTDRDLCRKMGIESREKVKDMNWKNISDKYINLYKNINA